MKYLLIFVATLGSFAVKAQTDSTLRSGNWSNGTIWSRGVVPNGTGKIVQISTNTQVDLDIDVLVDSVIVKPSSYIHYRNNHLLNNVVFARSIFLDTTIDTPLATILSIRNGNWTNIKTWNTNTVPIASSIVKVVNGTVSVNGNYRVQRLVVYYDASLNFWHNASINGITYQYWR
jgi:2-methylaconitate cis-trans-isomerase PrpF